MRIMHIGVVCRSERNADLFYGKILGLARQELKTIPVSIVKPLFGCDSPLPAINYVGTELRVEVFLANHPAEPACRLSHTCIDVENVKALTEKAALHGLTVQRIPNGDGWVVFLDDNDGNRFEIKEAVAGT